MATANAVKFVAMIGLLPLGYLGYGAASFGWILLLALVPQLIGHNGINYAMRYLEPTLVATTILLEPIGASLLAFLIFAEVPSSLTLVGAAVLLLGVVFTVRSTESPAPGAAPPEVPGD